MLSIPEDNQDELEGPPESIQTTRRMERRMEIDPLNEVAPVDDTSESDDSVLVIINKNEVPVCSTDFPPAKHENKKDWFKRRRQEVPIASTSTVEKSGDSSRRRKLLRITIPINPDSSGIREEEPLSSPKRRFLSLSPIKTIFPSKTATQQDRPLQSASSSPSSPKSLLGNKNFFRSTYSLTTSSLLRLPGSQKKDSFSRRLFTHKGKDRGAEPVLHERLQDNWEVVEQTADDEREDATRPEAEEHPQSLMSIVMSANGSTTTFLKNSPTKTKSRSVTPSEDSHSSAAVTPQTNCNSESISPQTPSPRIKPIEGQKVPDQQDEQTTDTPQTSGSPTPLARTPTASPQPRPTDPVILLQERSSPSAAPQSSPTPLFASPEPNVNIDPQTTERDVSEQNLEMPLPMTPVYQTNHERNIPSVIDGLKEKLPTPLVPVAVWCSPTASRSIPDLLTDSDHTHPLPHSATVCSCGTIHNMNSTLKSPLGMHMYPGYRTPTPPQFTHFTKASTVEEPMRPHYAGRPLPLPPRIPDFPRTVMNPVLTVNTTSAAEKSSGSLDGIRKEGMGKEKEGLLIDLEDTSLDTNPLLSPTITTRSGSDESRYHSQLYLPLMSSPSSSAIFTREPQLLDISFSPSSIQSSSTVILPGPNHLISCSQPRHQYPHNHRFPDLLSQHRQANGFSKSNLDLPSRFREMHDSPQSDVFRHHRYPRDIAGGGSLSHCHSCEHSAMPWATHSSGPSMPITHGVYQPQYHPQMTMDTQRQRQHLAHLSY